MRSLQLSLVTLFCIVSEVVSFDGCAGYVNLPKKGLVSLKDVKVQLFPEGSSNPAVETEVAPKSGFFHVSYEKLGSGLIFSTTLNPCVPTKPNLVLSRLLEGIVQD